VSIFSISFLSCHKFIENEAGDIHQIAKIEHRYWLWFLNCVTALAGAILIQIAGNKRNWFK